MNERIKELYGNALDKAVPYTWHNLDHIEVEKIMKEFSELIVKECAKAAGDFEYARLHDSLVEDHVLKHFGVE